MSLSVPVQLHAPIKQTNGAAGIPGWQANLFMFSFFDWLLKPNDVDGDGRITIVDGYKMAGIKSNHMLAQVKGALFVQASTQTDMLRALRQQAPPVQKMQLDAAETALQGTLMSLYLHQEPWLLHEELAREVTF
jgi:hypothetical protein